MSRTVLTCFTRPFSQSEKYRLVSALALCLALSAYGCASGSSSSSSPAQGSTTPVLTPNTNPPSLPAPPAATGVNTYVGTQVQTSAASANVISLVISQTASTYSYDAIALPAAPPDPVANSTGLLSRFLDFTALGDTTGATMNGMPGPQYFGMAAEETSRLAFFAPYTGQELSAVVPKQTSSCVSPTAAATYQFITLFNSSFMPATDAAWGTVSVAASGSGFTFSNALQFIQPAPDPSAAATPATTTLIPFAPGTCMQSATNPELGYFIDTPASETTGQTEVQTFLGPTGLLVSNLAGLDGSGNPLPLPSVVGMVQPSAPIDLTQVIGTVSSETTYKSYLFQPAGSPAVQYGIVGQQSSVLNGVDDTIFTSTNTSGLEGIWQGLTSFTSGMQASGDGGGGLVFGAQDAKNPGLFPNAQFLYAGTATSGSCPAGTSYFAGSYCASPAVAMVGIHDGKYVVLVTGAYQISGGTPSLLLMVQE